MAEVLRRAGQPLPGRHYCYKCLCEVAAVRLADEELACVSCQDTCVEELEEEATPDPDTSQPLPAPRGPRNTRQAGMRPAHWLEPTEPPSVPPPPAPAGMPSMQSQSLLAHYGMDPPGPARPSRHRYHAIPPYEPFFPPPPPGPPPARGEQVVPPPPPLAADPPQDGVADVQGRPRQVRWGIYEQASGHHTSSHRHMGFRCDGCNVSNFRGVRFRCLNCPNFDFCANCHSQRHQFVPPHPRDHTFEEIRVPVSPVVTEHQFAELLARGVIRVGRPVRQGPTLSNDQVAWWLADNKRLVSIDQMVASDPEWTCSICSEGVEAECEHGWVVQICGPPPTWDEQKQEPGSSNKDTTQRSGNATAAEDAELYQVNDLHAQRHVYHEGCLRRWLLTRNSCPICRRAPVVE